MRYNTEQDTVELSVRELCSIAFKSGDIDSRASHRKERQNNAEIGKAVHKKLQSEAKGDYNAEYTLSNIIESGGIRFSVSARADGVFGSGTDFTVDEIKSVKNAEFSMPPRDEYLAQLKCYAYFLCEKEGLFQINTRLIYYNIETDDVRYFEKIYPINELRLFYLGMIIKAQRWANLLIIRSRRVLPSIKNAPFPYTSLRNGQSELIKNCYSTMKRGGRLFVQAPTGIGKTVSTLYPTVKALGEEIFDKIFYLTSKASIRREAYSAAGKIFDAGARIKTIVLAAKDQMCICQAAKEKLRTSDCCNPIDCQYARGYYSRVDDAIFELLSLQNGFRPEIITQIARKYRICPYELSLDLSELCDVIICDYNYVFDPMVYLRRYFALDLLSESNFVFLIDEAHNLADRMRNMYSATLKNSMFEKLYSILPNDETILNNALEKIIRIMRGLKKLCRDNLTRDADGNETGFYISRNTVADFNIAVEDAAKCFENWLRLNFDSEFATGVQGILLDLKKYISILEYYDERFVTYIEILRGEISAKIFCLDPSYIADVCMQRAKSSVLFSATLTPLDYFCDLLGGGKNARTIELPSPFENDNICIIAVDSLSTRYEDRDRSHKKISGCIAATISAKKGNYMVYFPSYSYMESVFKEFSKKYPQIKTIVQKSSMTSQEKDSFLAEFKEGDDWLVGFCVLGGSFSEGIDLPGKRLIGSIIVGVGLPGISSENNIIRDYFENKREQGYDYAYTFPGMNNVLQAAGRVIRRETDNGVVVLIDDRYGTEKYKQLFPSHWEHLKYARNASSLAEIVKNFWSER